MISRYWLIIAFVLGLVIASLLFSFGPKTLAVFTNKTKLIKRYWLFVFCFAIVTIASYALVVGFLKGDKQLYVSILNQACSLVFASFVGYFAFTQVMEGRKDKLDQRGWNEFKQKNYPAAIEAWEQAFAIGSKDPATLSNLLEAYVVSGNNKAFTSKLPLLSKLTTNNRQLVPCYLSAATDLLKGHLPEAHEAIRRTIDLVKADPELLASFRWDFSDMMGSPAFTALRGDQRTLFNNYIQYLQGGMDEDKKSKFEGGDYLLTS